VDEVTFGRYRLIELLGRGGMGEVWRAHDTETKRTVAIKVLPPHLADDNEFVQRFRREAEAAAQLNSPHVVPIHNYGEIDGRLYVDMRLIEGRDLGTVLTEGPLEPARALRIIEGVALALHAAHQVGLLHRDVKPSNILLDSNDFAYLIDFGIARAADETRLTKSGNTIGTFAYIAPERLDGQGNEDARVDIYSLACVLYECLTGEPPFTDDTMPRLIVAHLSTPPPRPSLTRPDVPAQVDEVIATGMAKDPDQRYASSVELADAAHDAITTPIARSAQVRRTSPAAFATIPPATRPATKQQGADLELAATQQSPRDGDAGSPHHLLETQPADQPPPHTAPTTPQPWWQRQRRQVKVALIAATVVILAATATVGYLLAGRNSQPSNSSQPTTTRPPTTTPPVTPVAESALAGLLLTPSETSITMGTPGMTVTGPPDPTESWDMSGYFPDKACVPLWGPAETPAYDGSGWRGTSRGQQLDGKKTSRVNVQQYVLSFPSAHDAGAFFATSAQQWPACSNRQYTMTQGIGAVWTVGPVSNTNGTLSATQTRSSDGETCQRALTVANNVAIDIAVYTSRADSQSDSAVNIAHQIGAKVPTT
jgi:serine/threonine kinase PknH